MTALICAFRIPGDIVPWARARTKNGVHFTAPKVRGYQTVIRDYAYEAMEKRPPFDGPCRIRIDALYPWPASWSKRKREREGVYKKSKPDADNIWKALADGLNGIAFTDDARIADARVVKLYSETPGLVVEIWALQPIEAAA